MPIFRDVTSQLPSATVVCLFVCLFFHFCIFMAMCTSDPLTNDQLANAQKEIQYHGGSPLWLLMTEHFSSRQQLIPLFSAIT